MESYSIPHAGGGGWSSVCRADVMTYAFFHAFKFPDSMSVQIKGTSEIEKYPAQIICLVQQLDFCRRCERAITKSGLDELEKKTSAEIQELTNRKGSSNNLGKLKLTSVILDAIHHKDILNQVR